MLSASQTAATQGDYARVIAPNRSLTPAGRVVWWGLLCSGALIVATGAALLGAWTVLPFAGAEVALLTWAFLRISQHDGDFERLVIGGDEVVFESRHAKVQARLAGNRHWMTVEAVDKGGKCVLRLAYAGRRQPIGRLMGDAERSAWVSDLGRYMRIVRAAR